MRNAFSHHGFPRLYLAVSTSALGDSVMLLVMSMWAKTLTGSNAMAGLTFLFMLIPTLVAPLLGAWVDRLRRKPVVVWGDIASACIVLPLLALRDADHIWLLWAVSFCYGISFIVIPAAVNGLLKELLPEEVLVDANAAIQTTKEAYRLFGPLLGAWLFATWGGWLVALVDAASFLIAALVVARIPVREAQPQREDAPHLDQLLAGVRWIGADRILRQMTVGVGIMLLVVGFSESTIYALLDAFGRPATFAAVVVTVQGVGALVGGVTCNRLVKRVGEPAAVAAGLVICGLGALGAALSPTMPFVLASVTVVGYALPVVFVGYTTMQQRRTPHRLMGRVSMAVEVLMGVPQAVSLAVGAMLVVAFSYRAIWAVMGVLIIAGGLYIVARLTDIVRAGPVPSIAPD